MIAECLILIFALCNGASIDNSLIVIPMTEIESIKSDLPAPHIKTIKINDHPKLDNITMFITWTKVEHEDVTDPVIGYKLKIWEVKKIKNTRFELQGGMSVPINEEIYPKIRYNVSPDGNFREIVLPANATSTLVDGLTTDVAYQYAILAFTQKKEGNISPPTRIRVNPRFFV